MDKSIRLKPYRVMVLSLCIHCLSSLSRSIFASLVLGGTWMKLVKS